MGMKIGYKETESGNRWISESTEIAKMPHSLIKLLSPQKNNRPKQQYPSSIPNLDLKCIYA